MTFVIFIKYIRHDMKQIDEYLNESFRLRDDSDVDTDRYAIRDLFDILCRYIKYVDEGYELTDAVQGLVHRRDDETLMTHEYVDAELSRSDVIHRNVNTKFDELMYVSSKSLKQEIKNEIEHTYRVLCDDRRVTHECIRTTKHLGTTDVHLFETTNYVVCMMLCDDGEQIRDIEGVLVGCK